jgi:hypothetical protein
MAQELLHGPDVIVILQEVGGEGMAERVASDALVESGRRGRGADGLLQAAFIQMVAPRLARARVL